MAIRRGIDISRWQGSDLDIQNLKNNGIEFTIIKAGGSDDGRYEDSCFENFYQKSIDCGMPVGSYYFGRDFSLEEAETSANHYLSIVSGKDFDYPLYYDVEADMLNQDPRTLTDIIIRFCTIVKNAGYTVGVYSSKSPLNNQIYMNELINLGYEIWCACYYFYNENDNNVDANDYADTQYGMWQYSSFGQIDGHNGRIDMNYCYRDYVNEIPSNNSSTGEINMDNNRAIVQSLYQEILGRDADEDGLNVYSNMLSSGTSQDEIKSILRNSDEYDSRITGILNSFYNEILGRPADEEGINYYKSVLKFGEMTLDQIHNAMYNGDEAIFHRNQIAEEQAKAEADKIAEEQRIAEQEKLAENERIKANAENELQTSLSTTDTSYYTAIKDESTGLYNLVSNFGNDDSDISAEQETNRIAQKDAYERYNNIISSLYRITL